MLSDLRQDKGEVLIDHLGEIEDTKGNNGQTGTYAFGHASDVHSTDQQMRDWRCAHRSAQRPYYDDDLISLTFVALVVS